MDPDEGLRGVLYIKTINFKNLLVILEIGIKEIVWFLDNTSIVLTNEHLKIIGIVNNKEKDVNFEVYKKVYV